MDIGFFFTLGKEVVQLAVNPPSIKVRFKGNNEQVEIISLGEITLIGKRKLAEIEFETFLPGATWFPAIRTLGEFKGPAFYKDFFERIFQSQKEIYFSITGLNISMYATLEDFEYEHIAGDEEDPKVKFKLKEFTHYQIDVISVSVPATEETPVVVTPKASTKPRPATQITIGSIVVLTGRVHVDSAGGKPGKTFSKSEVKITLIKKGATHPYHVATLTGGALGWVTETAVTLK